MARGAGGGASVLRQGSRLYGTVLNNTKLYAYNVEVLKAIKGFAAAFAETKAIHLDQKALIRVRVATLNGCPF